MGRKQRAIYSADTWHVENGTASDGCGRALHHNPVRRVFSAEYKLAILAEYDACSESGEKGAILRREGLYSSLITDWRRQQRQGLLKAAEGRSDGGRGGRDPPGTPPDPGAPLPPGHGRVAGPRT
jgi:transposase-like protein